MSRKYFVTQERGSESHVAASNASMPVVIALTRRLTLYQGDRVDEAMGVAQNLIAGRLVTYTHCPDKGSIGRGVDVYKNGNPVDGTFSDDSIPELNPLG